MSTRIVIYNDEGVKEFCVRCLLKFFSEDDVSLCDAGSVIDGSAFQNCDIFVMPGGADLPYAKKLNGTGNRNIRAFVEGGGTYLGICAGAYYACEAIEYHKGRSDEICEPRELAFVPAVAIGSLEELAPFYDETLQSACITEVTFSSGENAKTFFQGGCRFDIKDPHNIEVLATYTHASHQPAIIRRTISQGKVILSGVHFEIGPGELPFHPAELAQALTLAKSFGNETRPDWHSLLFLKQR
jgi:glutamine amidotransferase-like uncharacterized protein